MLIRQKALLAMLSQADKLLSPTIFVKLVFLVRHETRLSAHHPFYDFLPYKYGPFSFTLYRESGTLRRDGYLTPEEDNVGLSEQMLTLSERRIQELPRDIRVAVEDVVTRHGGKGQAALVAEVYRCYPWFASRSELCNLRPCPVAPPSKPRTAVYTAGYEGKSVDRFFNDLLRAGIQLVIDVRARPLSRKYGFSGKRFSDIASRLGIGYRHIPRLGIPSELRAHLSTYASYQRLLKRYQREMLPQLEEEVELVGQIMRQTPAVLMCVERDVRCCHRGRLAEAIARRSGLEVEHL